MDPKKAKEIDNDAPLVRIGYVVMGLVLAVAVTLVCVEYISISLPDVSLTGKEEKLEDEEMEDIIFETPPPPQKQPPPVVEEIEVLEEDTEEEEDEVIIVDEEAEEIEIIEVEEVVEEEEPEIEQIYEVVEESPEFQGGMGKLYEYLGKQIQYPAMAKDNNIQGKVFVQFVVWKDGTIRDVKVVKGVHKSLDKEAMRVVKGMPKWKPGRQRGKAVSSRYTLPIRFRIS